MDIVDGIKLVARWSYVTLPIFLWSLVGAIVVTSSIQPEYRSEGSILFVAPSVVVADDGSGDEQFVNPLLVGASGLSTAAEIATLSINTPEVARILTDEGLSPNFAVGATGKSPILLIEAFGSSRSVAAETALRVTELIDRDLQLRQEAARAPEDQRVTTSVISLSSVGGGDYKGRTRIRIAVVVLGLGLAVGAAFLLESIRLRRGQRRESLREVRPAQKDGTFREQASSSSASSDSAEDWHRLLDADVDDDENNDDDDGDHHDHRESADRDPATTAVGRADIP